MTTPHSPVSPAGALTVAREVGVRGSPGWRVRRSPRRKEDPDQRVLATLVKGKVTEMWAGLWATNKESQETQRLTAGIGKPAEGKQSEVSDPVGPGATEKGSQKTG